MVLANVSFLRLWRSCQVTRHASSRCRLPHGVRRGARPYIGQAVTMTFEPLKGAAMRELPSVRRERRLRDELQSIRDIMRVVAEADQRPTHPGAVPVTLGDFASWIADKADEALA